MRTYTDMRNPDNILDHAVNRGALFADVRVEAGRSCYVMMDDGVLSIENDADQGIGTRVLATANGGRRMWGFSSVSSERRRELERMVRTALACARAGSVLRKSDIELAPRPTRGKGLITYATPLTIHPSTLSVEYLVELVRAWDDILRGTPYLISRSISLNWTASSELLAIAENHSLQKFFQNVCYIEVEGRVTVKRKGEVQTRSFRFGATGGFEFIHALNVTDHCKRIRSEVIQLLSAPECREENLTVILLPQFLGLITHEWGHGLEGDRPKQIGHEINYYGTSILGNPNILPRIGSFRAASPEVTILATATLPGGYGTAGFDHEGIVAKQEHPLILSGRWVGLMLSREMVPRLNQLIGRPYFVGSNGMTRAEAYDRIPLIRMSNTKTLPGTASTDELIASVRRGLIIDGPVYSWSMGFDRSSFSFGAEMAREIRNGKLGGVVRNVGIMGDTLGFWKSCAAMGREVEIYNEPNCGKGQPCQAVSTGHSTPPGLFHGVHIINRKNIHEGRNSHVG